MKYFNITFWKYLLHKPFSIKKFICRLQGHKCGVIWYNLNGTAPNMTCKNCEDYLD